MVALSHAHSHVSLGINRGVRVLAGIVMARRVYKLAAFSYTTDAAIISFCLATSS